jgi:hypothetical protein
MSTRNKARLSPLCDIADSTTSVTLEIRRGANGYRATGTLCSPACLNSRLLHPPNEDDISAMRPGALPGWNRRGADPSFWRRRREGRGE